MAAVASIKFTQGATTDTAGRAVKGSLTGGGVTVSNGDNTDVVQWKYELLYVPPGSSVVLATQGPGATTTFSFAQPDVPGSYRIRLTVYDGDNDEDVDIRNFCVPFQNGLLIPPFQENPLPLPFGQKPNEMNLGGQAFGWLGTDSTTNPLIYKALQQLDLMSGGGVQILTAQTADVSSTDILPVDSTGVFLVSTVINVTTAGSAGTIDVDLDWTDGSPISVNTINGFALDSLGYVSVDTLVRLTSGNISFTATRTGAAGSPVYSVYAVAKQVA